MKYYLAIDIGAQSGRHIIGYKEEGEIKLKEVYRFKNDVDNLGGNLEWNIKRLFSEVKNGIKEALKLYPKIESLSIDTWGVDYVLMNGDKEITPCMAYRDNRTKAVIDKVHNIISFEKLYEKTGIQFQLFNTIYQLYVDKLSGKLEKATDFLMMPEYLMYKLTGVKKKEYTNASTTGLVNAYTKEFDKEIIEDLGLKEELFKNLSQPGETLGNLKKEVQNEVGGNIEVVLCATHDTGSAVYSIDTEKNDAFISSGTWSLIGTKIDKPITTKESMDKNYANEGGVGYIRYLKNIMGLWLISELKKQTGIDFADMIELAKKSEYENIFDVNDEVFIAPKDMKKEITEWFRKRNMTEPKTINDLLNSVYHSLAYSYKLAIEGMEQITEKKFNRIVIVGGGAKNKYLNELTEKYTGKKVMALPIEATAIGNLKIQMKEKERI